MTVTSPTNTATFDGNGVTTVFPFDFRFFADTDLEVVRTLADESTVTLTLGVDYTVQGANDLDGGSITTTSFVLGVDEELTVARVLSPVQLTDLRNQGKFFAETHEGVFDYLTMLIQQVINSVGSNNSKALRVPENIPVMVNRAARAGSIQGWDENGNPIPVHPQSGSALDLALALANNTDPSLGAALVGYNAGTVADTLNSIDKSTRHITSFGVVGDGVTDDSSAFADVLAYSGHVVGDPALAVMVQGDLLATGSLKLDMRGGVVKQGAALTRITINAPNVEFRNTVFDGNGLNVNVCFFRIPTTYNGWRFDRCTFQNIAGIAGSANQYGIWADLDDAEFQISNCKFRNISNVSDGTPTSAFCGSMLLSSSATGCKDVRLENITVENVFCTGIAGNVNNSDADGIRVFGPQPTVQSNLQMRNITCIDVQKSGIKVSGNRGLIVDDVTVYNDRADVSMVAGVRFQAADYSVISNINLVGRMLVGVNIRSRNIVVDGVNYRPIDTARDTVASGLIQLQSDDTYVTQQVKVSNVVADNVTQAFDFDLTGVTVSLAFAFVEFHHWSIRAPAVVSSGTASRVQKASQVTLDHVYLWDASSAWINSITFNGVSNFKAHYCRFEARRDMFTWAPGDNGIEFDGCSFLRQDTASTENFGMLIIRDTGGGLLDRVAIRNCTISCPAYSAIGNQHAVRFYATNGMIDGLNIYVRDSGANVSPPSGWVSPSGAGMKISGVRVNSQSALTNGSGGYAVDLSTLVTGSVISDVMNNSGPGVRASVGANNNLIDTVAGKATAVANTGTSNTIGSAHVLP